MSVTPIRLAYLVTHPIQYQAPMLRLLAAHPAVDLTVFFASDFSVRSFVDPDFGKAIAWDVPLLDGYKSEVLPHIGQDILKGESPTPWRPFSTGLYRRFIQGRFDALWVHGYNRVPHWLAVVYARMLGMKVFIRDESTDISAERSAAKQAAKHAFFRSIDALTHAWLTIGSLNHAYYRGFGIAERKLFRVPYAVDNAFFQDRIAQVAKDRDGLRQRLGLEPGRPVILFAAKLIQRKRPMDLLQAYARIANEAGCGRPYLLFAGEGESRRDMETFITRHSLDGARILGFQTQGELAALYDLCDLFVLPSDREAWGLVVNEAMNAGRAIICSDRIGSAPDLVRPGENGYIFPTGDADALAGALRASLSDPDKLRAMGKASLDIINRWSFAEDIDGFLTAAETVFGRPLKGA